VNHAKAVEQEVQLLRGAQAVKAIVELHGRWIRGASPAVRGAARCPGCGRDGALEYRREGKNGHVTALCRAGCGTLV
jgi:hypothetical protein